MKKLVSIIIPAYNCERWLGGTIKSALVQTWPRKEIIIVDDGSTDRTLLIAKKYESKKVKIIHQKNGGVSNARNTGLKMAQGDYIQWLDADDMLDYEKIEKQLMVIEQNGNDILTTGEFGAFYFSTKRAEFRKSGLYRDLKPAEWIITRFAENAWMQAASWLMSRELCEKAGPWDERLCLDEDGEYFCRIVSWSNGVKFVQGAKSYYRIGNASSLGMNRSNKALDSLILSMELSFNTLRSIEDSERARNSCVRFLQHRMLNYYPDNIEMLEKVETLAKKMNGIFSRPTIGWKLSTAKKILGWEKALIIKKLLINANIKVERSVDQVLNIIESYGHRIQELTKSCIKVNIQVFHFILRYLLSLVLISYSITIGIFTKKGRFCLSNLLNFYKVSFMNASISTKLPNIEVSSVITKEKIEIIESFEKDGNITLNELAIINGIILKENPKKIFEIGTFDGRTTLNMAYNSCDGCQIYTLDLPIEQRDHTKFEIDTYDRTLISKDISGERIIKSDLNCKSKITRLFGDSATFDYTPFYKSIDLVFIDGAHDFNYAFNDSKTALKLIKKDNGIILWHDYKDNVPVVTAIESFIKIHPNLKIYHIQGTNLAYCKIT
jgi:glycosyltransferase involved in cell wall biosynthesis